METERWRRIESIFEAAVEKPPALRAAFLDAQCGDDHEIRSEIESLLRADEQSGDFLADLFHDGIGKVSNITKDTAIGPYRITERIAAGGMGVVYQAVDSRLDRRVALKFLSSPGEPDDPAHQRFLLEAKAASSLDHPNICTIHDIGHTPDGHIYIVMPYYEGQTLERLMRHGSITLATALWVAVQIADGLRRAHHQQIWHRDLKPANIMVSPDNRATILDFGIAKFRGFELTSVGVRLGTLAYMAPEQLRAESIDHRVDIWALGAIVYEMLARRRLFSAERDHQLMYAILEEPIARLTTVRADVPDDVAALVADALTKDVGDRLATMDAMYERLVSAYREHGQDEIGEQAAPAIGVRPPNLAPTEAPRSASAQTPLGYWLEGLGLARYEEHFVTAEVDEDSLVELNEQDLTDLGIPIGPRKKLIRAIAQLTEEGATTSARTQLAITRATADTAGRRQITVMFCDLVESTALSRALDPEDLRDVLDAYEKTAMSVVQRFDGHVAQRLGDGLLVYFGYPQAHEDDPERAVSTGLEIITAVQSLELRADLRLQTRVGIATGEVVISQGDGRSLGAETAVGEAPNLASRLLALAAPDTVVIAQATRQRVAELFEYEDLGTHDLKGYAEPVAAWRVTGSHSHDRFIALRGSRAITATVGRDDEVALLQRRWAQAKAGQGQVVLLSGQPGIGKSKLAGSLREDVADEAHVLLRYYGSPYYSNTVLFPIVEQIAGVAGINTDDSTVAKLKKLEALLERMEMGSVENNALIASLLNVDAGDRYPPSADSPARQRTLTLQMLEAQLKWLASQNPVLVIFEDLHWVDATSIDLLTQLIENLHDMPVLMVLTCRPEFAPPWAGEAHVTVETCKRLTDAQALAIIDDVSGAQGLPSALKRQIVERAGGVPLFLEELVAAVLAADLPGSGESSEVTSGAYARVVPVSLQDSLMAQLDRLGPTRGLAQVAACLGRQFGFELLLEVTGIDEVSLAAGLDELAQAGLVQRRGSPPHSMYFFKHALVQDAAYGSLLRSRRKELHARTANVLQSTFEDRVHAEPELLAHHWSEAEEYKTAIDYWHRASRIAIRKSAYVECIEHLSKGIGLLDHLASDEVRQSLELELLADLGPALIATKGYASADVEETYERALVLCGEVGDRNQRVRALLGQGLYRTLRADYDRGWDVSEQAFAIATEAKNTVFVVDSQVALATNALFLGQFAESLRLYEAAYAEWRNTDRQTQEQALKFATDSGVVCRSYGARALWFLGHPDRALAEAKSGLELARELNHSLSIAQSWCLVANIHQVRGEVQETLETSAHVAAYAADRGYPYWVALAEIIHGWALAHSGNPDEGAKKIRTYLGAYTATGAQLGRTWFLAMLADAERVRENFVEGLAAIDEGLEVATRTGESYYAAELHRLHAELLWAMDNQAGDDAIATAYDLARGQEAKSMELRICMHAIANRRSEWSRTALRDTVASMPEPLSATVSAEATRLLALT
ncbi:MAG: protein kinase [Pseudomonadota bacterium]